MSDKTSSDMLMWAYGFICNAVPLVESAKENGWDVEAEVWLEAFNEKFNPEFHEYLKKDSA